MFFILKQGNLIARAGGMKKCLRQKTHHITEKSAPAQTSSWAPLSKTPSVTGSDEIAMLPVTCTEQHHKPYKTSLQWSKPKEITKHGRQKQSESEQEELNRGEPLTSFFRHTSLWQLKYRIALQVQILLLSSEKNMPEYPWKGKVFKKVIKPQHYHCYKKGNFTQLILAML